MNFLVKKYSIIVYENNCFQTLCIFRYILAYKRMVAEICQNNFFYLKNKNEIFCKNIYFSALDINLIKIPNVLCKYPY